MTTHNVNKRLELFYKAQAFLVMTLSSLGFTAGLAFVRVLGEESDLSDVLNYQSSITLLSFVLQLGYRASLRKYYYEGYTRVVDVSHDFFYLFVVISASVAYLIQYYIQVNLYIVSSLVVAYLTFLQTQAVVRQKLLPQLCSAIGNFFICVAAGIGVVVFSIDDYYIFEAFALFVLIFFSRNVSFRRLYMRRAIVIDILVKSQSYQIGSLMIMLMVFVLTQSVIHRYSDSNVIVAFADIQLISGLLTLVFGQALVLFEKNLYGAESAKYTVFLQISIFIAAVSALASVLFAVFHGVDFNLLLVFIIILNSRVLLGYVIQYVDNNRRLINLIAIAMSALYSIYYMFMVGEYLDLQIIPVLFVLMVGGYMMRPISREKNAETTS